LGGGVGSYKGAGGEGSLFLSLEERFTRSRTFVYGVRDGRDGPARIGRAWRERGACDAIRGAGKWGYREGNERYVQSAR
jgi:hypothetical protein